MHKTSVHPAQLLISSSEKEADLYYATRFIAPDPFIFAKIRGKKYLLVSDLEIDRARSQARVDAVVSTSKLAREYKQKTGKNPSYADLLCYFLKIHKVKNLIVPASFPLRYADPLRRAGFKMACKNDPFFEERQIKTPEEIASIRQALRATERSVGKAIATLKRSAIRNGKLYFKGKPLTSESLRRIIDLSLLEDGFSGEHTIVSCGNHTVDPHDRGTGPLRAHQPIIMDVFPRSKKTLYHGDFTRTVVRGKASPKLKAMYAAVKQGQEIAFRMIRAGISGRKVHEAIQNRFTQLGFRTGLKNGRMQGFFHSTGHGLGLEVHEPPRISIRDEILRAGHVVTVEPGLYYKGTGGVRLEDVVAVTRAGCTLLTKFPRPLEI
ncbi:MAG TPA: Xaa-Pro peptidase family protein [Candidatus Omnitrophota bacterium]|nr:Xaa-Pro peptidase family protein [Candidatus Omnitrophota bacterium]HPS36804.1 Xaa-Pro peptidase family protein [Candidatus Omnitrophota bacterium]